MQSRRAATTLRRTLLVIAAVFATVSLTNSARAQALEDTFSDFENRWATTVFELPIGKRDRALKSLLFEARDLADKYSDLPKAVAWHGIVANECLRNGCMSRSTRLRREARDALLKAESLDPLVLDGLVYATLGTLYSQAPTYLGGFGSKTKGIGYMWRAIVLDPEGLDANYLYAELLVDEERYRDAREVLIKASALPPRPDHLRADLGRQRQIEVLLQKVESQLNQKS
jgi:tetratricopeptide (TPR) repeat protein